MSGRSDVERPTSVSVIGWIWLMFAGYLLLRNLIDLVAWNALAPLRPTLLANLRDQAPGLERVSVLLEYAVIFYAAKALFGAAAFVAAWRLLALREWARVAMQVVGWIALAYVATFAAFWSRLWPRVAAAKAHDPEFVARSYARVGLLGGLAACIVVATALVAQILLLRRDRVRAVFRAAGGATAS